MVLRSNDSSRLLLSLVKSVTQLLPYQDNSRTIDNGPQAVILVIQQIHKVAEDISIWAMGPQCSVNIFNLFYCFTTYLHMAPL